MVSPLWTSSTAISSSLQTRGVTHNRMWKQLWDSHIIMTSATSYTCIYTPLLDLLFKSSIKGVLDEPGLCGLEGHEFSQGL